MKGRGKVYIVGAGPGDPGLLTLRASGLLREADVVVYDRLVADGILELVRPGALKVYAGKEVGEARAQGRINRLLVSHASKGRIVVRLKGGDPMIFGRGGEEAEFLAKKGVQYEVVPGVSSSFAAPAYAGIPLTHRDYSSSVIIVTGRESSSKRARRVRWASLAKAADTIVVMMGAESAQEIARQLVEGGLHQETPVAVIHWGTTRNQRVDLFDLGSLVLNRGRHFEPPSVIVIGDVAGLAGLLDWFRVDGRSTLQTKGR